MTLSDTFHYARNNLYVEHTPEQVAIMLMKRGIDGEKAGNSDIYDRLLEVFGTHAPGMPLTPVRQNAIRTVRRWVDGFGYEGLDVPYAPDEVDEVIRSYVHRLAIVKAAMFKGEKLTVREAKEANRTLIEFQDPHGEKVDLLAQYAVLWELSERKATGTQTIDIEDLFAYAPWISDEASQLYRLAKETGLIETFAWLKLMAVLVHPDSPPDTKFADVMTGMHAHLNLPYIWSYVRELPDDKGRVFGITYRDDPRLLEDSDEPTDAEFCKSYCSWREYVRLIQSGASTEIMTAAFDRDEQENPND
jgi:hypothetical protein